VTITFEVRHGTCLLALEGEFDRANVGELAGAIEECLRNVSSIALDFQAVTFVDGGVLSLLHDVLESLEGQGWLAVVRPTPWVRRLIAIAGLSERRNFRLFSTMKETLEAIDRG
jgi:anti-anti-sigma factor